MHVLIACEESQTVCKAFRRRGHEAFSCDIQDCSGGHPEWHIKDDVIRHLYDGWDLIIAHPPCTHLCNSGSRWWNIKREDGRIQSAVDFFLIFTHLTCKWAIENPVGLMSTYYRKPDQIIQPWQFGDPYEKRTCIWLNKLPELTATKIVEPPPRRVYSSGCTMPEWYSNAPVKDRSKFRSRTFPGIAEAMADQWGKEI